MKTQETKPAPKTKPQETKPAPKTKPQGTKTAPKPKAGKAACTVSSSGVKTNKRAAESQSTPNESVLPLKKRRSGHDTKVRNILRRASTAPGQSKVSDYLITPLSDTLPDLEDFDLTSGPYAMSSPTRNRGCICHIPAPALSPIKRHRIHSNVIVISDSD